MKKYAFAFGIVTEWWLGPAVHSVEAFGYACLRALMLMALAWMLLEASRLLGRALSLLPDGER